MSTANVKHLGRAALAAHRDGRHWADFWAEHAEQVRQCEPYNNGRYHRLVVKLLHLLCSGDSSGMEPAGNGLEAWEVDDQQPVDDVRTSACCQLSFLPMQEADRLTDRSLPRPPS